MNELTVRNVQLDPANVPTIIDDMIGFDVSIKIDGHLADAKGIKAVDDAKDYKLATDIASWIKGDIKTIEGIVSPVVDILNKMHKAATTHRGNLTGKLDAESRRLADLATRWWTEEERKKREEAARIQREQEAKERAERTERDRLARIESERIEAEARAKREQAARIERENQAEADRLRREAFLKEAEAQKVIDQRVEDSLSEAMQRPTQVIAAPVLAPGTKTAGSMRTTWKARVIDKMALIKAAVGNPYLASLLLVDESTINKMASTQQKDFHIPGVEAYPEVSTAIRAAK